MTHQLVRRVLAEGLGTCFLVCAVVGSGIAAQRLSPGDAGLQLLENSLITGSALLALILALQSVSAAFNPLVTFAEVVLNRIRLRDAWALAAAQIVGGIIGTILANLMFNLSAINISTHHRASGAHLLGEVVATFGLVVVIFGVILGRRPENVAYAVAGYITAAYWFTSSTSFANPAVTIARMFSNTFAGIAPVSVVPFVIVQLAGAVLAVVVVRYLLPQTQPERASA